MYVPKNFEVTDPTTIADFVRANPFAAMVSVLDGAIIATHLPVLAEGDVASGGVLLGHVARANDHIRAFDGATESFVIFSGPHAYVSPTWYASGPAVPTWNYGAVHVYGVATAMTPVETIAFVTRLTDHFEGSSAFSSTLSPDYVSGLARGIVGFRLAISRVEAKFKLSQNRPAEDAPRVVQELAQHEAAGDRDLAALMSSYFGLASKEA
jgi:transcriptional regulator